ncbi:contractile injection system tape measure protein [Lewinella cohaerens]|uniref:contractile injection system tape measure protein n=1 Tax=Lewinella cohaerens TaxID=70995 RepID=UPI00037375E5|nr:contractile injection system tape measure protein [Lewinella cohaerens]
MPTKQIHIIKQLELELTVQASRDRDYHATSERLSVLGQERIPEIIDRVLSELVPPDVYVRYDKIVLDCDLDSLEDLESEIRRQLAGELELFLKAEEYEKMLRPRNKLAEGRENSLEAATGPEAWIIHFLERGYLPWSAPKGTTVASLAYEFTELLTGNAGFVKKMHHLLLQNENCFKRMLAQFGSVMLHRLVGIVEEQQAPLALLSFTEQLEYWTKQLKIVAKTGDTKTTGLGKKTTVQESLPMALERSEYLAKNSISQQRALSVPQAGLVLLHPFIDRFLTLHGAVSNHEIIDLNLGASLLQSLVVGESPTAEWELVLPKILLGIPLEEVLVLPELTEAQLTSGDELIEAAIRHWSALGKTSVAGFRANFLQRDGLLYSQGTDWHLQVAQAPYDLLLDRLPWNISMIKLPWMEGMLKVDFR